MRELLAPELLSGCALGTAVAEAEEDSEAREVS